VLTNVRYFLADVVHWLSTHKLVALGALALLAGGVAGGYLLIGDDDDSEPSEAPAPRVVVREVQAPEEPEELGFPAFATKNTTRIAGADPIADAAGTALAVDPSTGGVPGPNAVTVVDAADWQAGIAAASLVADPVGAPILISEDGELPGLTGSAIAALAPPGSPDTDGRQVFAVGPAAKPDGFDALEVQGSNAAAVAAEIEQLRTRLAGKPEHLLITTSEDPAIAMPAASWAARSGDPVLYVTADGVPEATREALSRHRDVPIYVLGGAEAIPAAVVKELDDLGAHAERVGAEDPVENAIAFARFSSGSFGWNINDPGHGLVIANAARPLDAAAAAPLSASGTWGPLLITTDAGSLPDPLHGYLLDLKPGFETDPTRAVYNHVWVIGDPDAVSVDVQAQIDELAEVAQVGSGIR
jgi:hypothetical protein